MKNIAITILVCVIILVLVLYSRLVLLHQLIPMQDKVIITHTL